jgi:hypothetical protein
MGKLRPAGQLRVFAGRPQRSISSADDIQFEIFIVSNCLLANNTCKANSRLSKIRGAVPVS